MEKAGIPMRSSYEFSDNLAAPSASEIDELAERSESLEQRVSSLNDSYETLKKREGELTEWRWAFLIGFVACYRVDVMGSLTSI
jgi:V-type H+-transporting ATPase subunit a